ncbi:MAG: uracil-xanthine permease family protein [Leuconostoc mesenteroides]|jgi:uracil permease|uniref:Uracil permease n=2 Tax=Leuconostoc mesenteroides TaxID=1245 RepID=A0A843YXJ4_LEUME|nr:MULTISPECIES: solute carrier family 23 protein [Leuconostoc]ABJ62950.1 Xanthine/uracil permease [Leuconostoc mesenteroides subsp. mesenteroides ATCC 8293]AET31067.1 uracil permease [Leuconostoc mesenteroides subsp. mesenteroides J18]AKP35952.1 uracil permease [Leuconostoc mesenteroides subsp. dextranicum]AQU50015.1 uracil permease [Leuconostoc mesenteroides subsp. mesenteroides]ARN64278.1 uracil permease [Leuconostoc mesenteroides subsp. mesenteroides]
MSKNQNNAIYDLHDKPPFFTWLGLSLQHLFSMFGATVLVPLLVGLNPGVALFTSGVGTLLHLLITRGKVPAYMGSSFAFIIPMTSLLKTVGYPAVAQGIISVGLVYLVVAFIVTFTGTAWIEHIFPAEVVGPIIMVIGLSLAGSAASSATTMNGHYDIRVFTVALVTLLATIAFNMFLRGFLGLLPVLLGIIFGYIVALITGLVDLSPVASAHWFQLPNFETFIGKDGFVFYPAAVLSMAPLALVTLSEHLGHLMVLSKITGTDFFENPGLKRTLTGDGTASVVAGLIGGPAVTSYGENIGVMQLSRVYSVWVIGGAAFFAVVFSFVGKLSALISTIPGAVTGGVGFMLYGVIAAAGLQVIVDNKVDYSKKRNLMIAAPIMVVGIGNFHLQLSTQVDFSGVAIATILGIVLNLVLPKVAASEK